MLSIILARYRINCGANKINISKNGEAQRVTIIFLAEGQNKKKAAGLQIAKLRAETADDCRRERVYITTSHTQHIVYSSVQCQQCVTLHCTGLTPLVRANPRAARSSSAAPPSPDTPTAPPRRLGREGSATSPPKAIP